MSTDPSPAFSQPGPPSAPLRTRMAVAAPVLGIISLFPHGDFVCAALILSLVALVLGIVATVRASKHPAVYGGKRMAIAGICLGGAALLWATMVALVQSQQAALRSAHRAEEASTLRNLGQACLSYASENDQFPPNLHALVMAGAATPDQLQTWRGFDHDETNTCDFHFVSYPPSFESRGDAQATWIIAFSDPTYHDGDGASVVFMDGHAEFITEPEFTQTLDTFKRNYEAEFGEPPVILPPD